MSSYVPTAYNTLKHWFPPKHRSKKNQGTLNTLEDGSCRRLHEPWHTGLYFLLKFHDGQGKTSFLFYVEPGLDFILPTIMDKNFESRVQVVFRCNSPAGKISGGKSPLSDTSVGQRGAPSREISAWLGSKLWAKLEAKSAFRLCGVSTNGSSNLSPSALGIWPNALVGLWA